MLRESNGTGLLFVVAIVLSGVGAAFVAQAPNSWSYNGPLGSSAWWNTAYPTCDGTQVAEQSPINISTASVSPSRATLHLAGTANPPPYFLHAVVTSGLGAVNMFSTLRADVWASELELNVAASIGIPRIANSTRFYLNSIVVHGPAEHAVDGVAADLELQYVFFRNSAKTPSTGALVISSLIVATPTPTAQRTRVEEMLTSFTRKDENGNVIVNTGAVLLPLTFPNSTSGVALYNGSLSFPPCWGEATAVVYTSSIPVDQRIVSSIRRLLPSPVNGRRAQALRGRRVDSVRVLFKSAELSFPISSYSAPQNGITAYVQILDDELDFSGMAIQFSTLYVGLICLELLCAAAWLFVEKRSFVSFFRDEWRNQLTDKSDFGSAPPPIEEHQEAAEEEEDEEGEYEDDDDDDD